MKILTEYIKNICLFFLIKRLVIKKTWEILDKIPCNQYASKSDRLIHESKLEKLNLIRQDKKNYYIKKIYKRVIK